jgi:hypothetical protein
MKRRKRRKKREEEKKKTIFKYSLPHTKNAVSITETNHLMLQLHGNSAGRFPTPCLTDKRRPNALPDTLPVFRPTSSVGEF